MKTTTKIWISESRDFFDVVLRTVEKGQSKMRVVRRFHKADGLQRREAFDFARWYAQQKNGEYVMGVISTN